MFDSLLSIFYMQYIGNQQKKTVNIIFTMLLRYKATIYKAKAMQLCKLNFIVYYNTFVGYP